MGQVIEFKSRAMIADAAPDLELDWRFEDYEHPTHNTMVRIEVLIPKRAYEAVFDGFKKAWAADMQAAFKLA